MRSIRRLAVVLPLILLGPAACSSDEPTPMITQPPATAARPPSAPPPSSRPAVVTTGDPATRAAATVRTLADEDLVGQVLMPYAYGDSATGVSGASAAGNQKLGGVDTPADMVAKFRLGGVILVGFSADDPTGGNNPTSNVDNPRQVRALTDGLQQAATALPARVPLLIGTDQEFGTVTRIREGMTILPAAMAFGAAGRPALTEAAWRVGGTELAAVGVNVDFAPVADTLRPQGNAVIGSRSYGSDPRAVAAQVGAAVKGLQGAGVASALKHFPGHGHTTADSHDELPVVAQNRATLDREDVAPFAAGIAAGAALVMSGHLDVTAVDPGVPATFSRKVMTDLLRSRLKFGGVAVTDAMNMAPAKRWPPGEAAVRALNAGNDLLLMPPDLTAARDGLLAALRDGSLPRGRLTEAVTRVLTLKFRYAGRAQPELSALASAPHQAAVRAAAAAAVTVLRGRCTGVLVTGPVTVTASNGREQARATMVRALQQAGLTVHTSGGAVVHLVGYGDRGTDLNSAAAVTVMMDTPYLLAAASSPTLLATYSSSPLSLGAAAAVLAGKARAPGRSPVPVPGLPATTCRA